MDSNCKAEFNPETSSYVCRHCSKDCIINQATKLAEKEDYDVYILPGASCLRKIFENNYYEGLIGIACTDELKLAREKLNNLKIPAQGIPLIKNGCSETRFNFETLQRIIVETRPKRQEICMKAC